MVEEIEGVLTEIVRMGYTVTYLGKGLGEYNERLMITGDLYQAEVLCKSGGSYKLRYKLRYKDSRNNEMILDTDTLDDLRDVLEPNLQELVKWTHESEPFVYILNAETNEVRNLT